MLHDFFAIRKMWRPYMPLFNASLVALCMMRTKNQTELAELAELDGIILRFVLLHTKKEIRRGR